MYDFYGKTLTEKQREIIDLYYFKDLSLSEIGENLKISRQAVYDNLKRAERQLRQLEQQLGLVERFIKERDKFSRAAKQIDRIIERLEEIKEIPGDILEDLEGLKGVIGDILGG